MVEPRCTPPARPRSLATTVHLALALRTGITVFHRTSSNGQEGGADFRQGNPCQVRHAMGNPIVAMMRVPACVTIQLVPHVQKFFRDHDLDGRVPCDIDPVQIDENSMPTACADKAIRATDRSTNHAPADPAGKGRPVSGNVKVIGGERQQHDVFHKQIVDALITHFEDHSRPPSPVTSQHGSPSAPISPWSQVAQ